ncbi:G-type lectin S-receptor-like serine/threonine-protein kinase [Dorcoceras hygrometricum]|uniref:Receptor-like serine/threonine-protein kinase n=1 Tax=Dorcoceras hygrometricum TaxID=472368 RepID=A0A2Z7CW19_9LAMI|nr:G-type lectin S-receptor-like serine/threonine-protein kinase [Dorcoceras hygrometricum]
MEISEQDVLSFIQESENTYFAAITYNGIPVWKAGGDPGGAVDSSANLRFLPSGDLQLLTSSTSGSIVWRSNTSGLGITVAFLDDSGNFVLSNGVIPMWTTFDNPTDTILPGQNFTVNHVLRSGLYSFRLLRSGNITLQWNETVYYGSSPLDAPSNLTVKAPSLGMQPVGILQLFDPLFSRNPLIIARDNDYGEIHDATLRFVKLDSDGNLRIYSSSMSSGSGNKIVRWTAVSDQCQVFGYCGNMGICTYDEVEFAPVCRCPSQNFELIDPKDSRKGCKYKEDIQHCLEKTMLPLNNSVFLTYAPEYDSDFFTANMAACWSNCLSGPVCIASTSFADGTGVCYMKKSGFISGYQSPALTSTSYVKVCYPALPNPQLRLKEVDSKRDPLKIVVVALGVSLGMVILVCGLLLHYRSKPGYESLLSQSSPSEYASGVPVQFTYKQLLQATRGFKEKLGEGGFGTVYRGIISNNTVVAVKQLEGIGQGEKQFRMEVATISSTHHLNLVRLIGHCSEGRHRLLVYEFLKNGSLDSFLYGSDDELPEKKVLNWQIRYNIALGLAKGITYLHEECRDCILHGDIKPGNILLDENYNCRVSDFGLAKLLTLDKHRQRGLSNVRGTRGYLAPEWLASLPITAKADVYSYGMVLLEMVSGRRNFEVSPETDNKRFSLWAYEELFEKGNLVGIVDKRLLRSEVDMEQVTRAVQVSYWCIQEQPSDRPSMGRIVQVLEGIAQIHKPPPPMAKIEGSPCMSPERRTEDDTSILLARRM